MSIVTLGDALTWPTEDKIKLLGTLRTELWREQARPEQIEPPGDWRTWYCAGGRGSGKSRSGAETLCGWINDNEPGDWAIVAPTFADARDTCVESESGVLRILGPAVKTWNRSLGELMLYDGSRIFLDGADDGALRIQGRNLRGAWCDECGLWSQWDRAWNESLSFAVRHEPSRIVATGTPKMGHGLVKMLMDDPSVPKSQMRISDNIQNLNPAAVRELYAKYGGTRLGAQELDGEWLEAIEGDMLKRAWWKFFDPKLVSGKGGFQVERLPTFQMILISVDTPLKDKETSDFVALGAWGVIGADRYLLDLRNERLSFDQAKRAVVEMSQTMRKTFTHCQHRVLIENAGYGVELIADLSREIGGVHKISVGAEGNKTMRALAASSDLETGNCFLPGFSLPDLSGPDPNRTAAWVISFIDQCALFPEGPNDDMVDMWSQAINWLRTRAPSPMRTASGFTGLRQQIRNPFAPSRRGGFDGSYRR